MFALYVLSKAAEEGPNTGLSWMLYIVLGVFFLMIIVGWAVSSTGQRNRR